MKKLLTLTLGTAFALISSNASFASGVTHTIGANATFESGFELKEGNTLSLGNAAKITINEASTITGKIIGDGSNELVITDGKQITVKGGFVAPTAITTETAVKAEDVSGIHGADTITDFSQGKWTSFISDGIVIKSGDTPITAANAYKAFSGDFSGKNIENEIITTHNLARNLVVLDMAGDEGNQLPKLLPDGAGSDAYLDIKPGTENAELAFMASIKSTNLGPQIRLNNNGTGSLKLSGSLELVTTPVTLNDSAKPIFTNVYALPQKGIVLGSGCELNLAADALNPNSAIYQLTNPNPTNNNEQLELNFADKTSILKIGQQTNVKCKVIL